MLDAVLADVRFGLRRLRSRPGFTLAAVLTLALGIGANVAIFSVIHGVLLAPLPYVKGDEIVSLTQHAQKAATPLGFSPVEMRAFRDQTKTLDVVSEYHNMYFILLGRKEPLRVATGVVSSSFFDLLGIRPAAGRAFLPSDEKPGAEPVLVLSYKFWRQGLGGPADIVGKTFSMNDHTHTVVGIMPPLPAYPDDNDVYMPWPACPFRSSPRTVDNPRARMLALYARLRPGVTPAAVSAELETISRRVASAHPEAYVGGPLVIGATPVQQEMTSDAKPTLLLLLATTGLVLLIACANVANLTLAQLMRRGPELAMRSALGAGRGRLIRQLVTESTLVSLSGGALGLVLATWGRELLVRYAARFTPRAEGATIDTSVLLFALGVSLVSGIVFGLVPALPRREALSPALLSAGGRMTAGSGGLRTRSLLIVTQVAISFVLLIGAGLLVRSLLKLQNVDPGIDAERVITMRIGLNFTKYQTPEQRRSFEERLRESLKTLPGVVSAALGGTFPFNAQGPFPTGIEIEGRHVEKGQPLPQVLVRFVSPEYFDTMKVPLLTGRNFRQSDGPDAPNVGIVSKAMARRYWGNDDPVGRRVTGDGGDHWMTIVGVAADVRQQLDQEPKDEVYLPTLQAAPLQFNAIVRTATDPRLAVRGLREAVWAIDPEQPVDAIRTIEEARSETLAPRRLTVLLLGLFAAVALLITATGIGGVVAYSVTERTQEIGIRMALGAERGDVLAMVLKPSLSLVALGLTLGIAGALALTRFLSALLFGIGPADPMTFVSVALVLSAIALTASFVPARRATSIEPLLALRTS
jgi:putative ABC transport system permease protein